MRIESDKIHACLLRLYCKMEKRNDRRRCLKRLAKEVYWIYDEIEDFFLPYFRKPDRRLSLRTRISGFYGAFSCFPLEVLDVLRDYYWAFFFIHLDLSEEVPRIHFAIERCALHPWKNLDQLLNRISEHLTKWEIELRNLFMSGWTDWARAYKSFLSLGRILHGLLGDCLLICAALLKAEEVAWSRRQ